MFIPPRRRGRPRAANPLHPVMTRLPETYMDRIYRLASHHDISVSKAVRKILIVALDKKS
jgi:hypothetical protein